MSLSMVEGKLPPGFRFHPKDDELICDYLMKKLLLIPSSSSADSAFTLLIQGDLNKCEPWDIPARACVGGKEWYFYSQRDRKYATGLRTNRATVSGYWKATGKDRAVARQGRLVGMRKTLVFYQGRAPKGKKTEWVMHEFRLEPHFAPSNSEEDWVLCRVFHKSRESNPTQMNGYDESGCSSLPDLMDSLISFDQTDPHPNDDENRLKLAYEQVPCFSSQLTNPNTNFHVAPNQAAGPYDAPALYGNNKLEQVMKDLTASPSAGVGGGSSSESYLSDVGFSTSMSTMWTSNSHY